MKYINAKNLAVITARENGFHSTDVRVCVDSHRMSHRIPLLVIVFAVATLSHGNALGQQAIYICAMPHGRCVQGGMGE